MKWIKYYGLSIGLLLISCYIFKDFINISKSSFVPLFFFILFIFVILDYRIFEPWNNKINNIKYKKRDKTDLKTENYVGNSSFVQETDDSYWNTHYYRLKRTPLPKFVSELYLYTLPFFVILILFFSHKIKYTACFIYVFASIMLEFLCALKISIKFNNEIRTMRQKNKEQQEKELKEQLKKEELGRYK